MRILEYIGNPENDIPTRDALAVTALRVTRKTLYKHFTPDELSALEKEGPELRRTKYAPGLSKADTALLREAARSP